VTGEVTDPVKFDEEMALNIKAYEAMRDQLRREYAGQYVAIAFGRLVTVAPTFDEASAVVLALDPPPQHWAVFEAEGDPMFDLIEDPHIEFTTDEFIQGP
jgi:hypothetical protein